MTQISLSSTHYTIILRCILAETKQTPTEQYHPIVDHTEFYSMLDLNTPAFKYQPSQRFDAFDDSSFNDLISSATSALTDDLLPR